MGHNSLSRTAPCTWGGLRQQIAVEAQCGRKSEKASLIYMQSNARHNLGPFSLSHALVLHTNCQTNSALRYGSVVYRLTEIYLPKVNGKGSQVLIHLFAENCAIKSTWAQLGGQRRFGKYRLHDTTFQLGNNVQSKPRKRWLIAAHNTLNIYIDYSKMKDGAGTGIYCPELRCRIFKLPHQCCIFQAEVYAIGKAAELASIASTPESTFPWTDKQQLRQ